MSSIPSLPFDASAPALGIRLTHPDDKTLEDYKNFLISYAVPLIIVIENADDEVNRTHTHALLSTNISLNTFRKQLKKKFPQLNGNSDYSLTQVKDANAMLRYVCKGLTYVSDYDPDGTELFIEPPQIIYSSIWPLTVATAHREYWEENKKLKQSHKQRKQPKILTWTELCWEDVQNKVPPFEFARREEINAITAIVLRHLGSTARKLPLKIISDMVWGFVNALIIKYPDERAFKNWSEHVADQIYANHPFSL